MKDTKTPILKIFLISIPVVFLLMIIWLAFVYIGNVYFHSEANAGQYLMWLMSGLIIFIFYPLFSKIYLSRWTSKKTHGDVIRDIPKLQRTDWLLFIALHLIGMPILFWIFSDIQTHIDIHNYFIEHFGRGTRGNPRFPIMLMFMIVPLAVFSFLYLVLIKIKYATFNEPTFINNESGNNFRLKRKVYFSFVISTSVTIMLCYILKMILMI